MSAGVFVPYCITSYMHSNIYQIKSLNVRHINVCNKKIKMHFNLVISIKHGSSIDRIHEIRRNIVYCAFVCRLRFVKNDTNPEEPGISYSFNVGARWPWQLIILRSTPLQLHDIGSRFTKNARRYIVFPSCFFRWFISFFLILDCHYPPRNTIWQDIG